MKEVEKKFKNRAIQRENILLFNKKDSLDFVNACKEMNIRILGIDGFILTQNKIQPTLENSVDFSSNLKKTVRDIFAEAIKFLNKQSDEIFFEIVCEE